MNTLHLQLLDGLESRNAVELLLHFSGRHLLVATGDQQHDAY